VKRLPKALWVILAVFAFANGLEALRYLLPHVPFPAELDNFIHRRVALSLHARGGAIALMAGPLRFLARFRESNWNRHRLLRWIYCGGVLLGWCASVWIAPPSQTGWIAAWGFLTLGAAWIVTTALAVRSIWRGDAAPPVDNSQLRTDGGSRYFADVPASCFRVSLAVFDCLSCDRLAVLCRRRRG
jgi:hypothetical protein